MENSCSLPLLSFVVPCYNVEKYVRQCLDSIFACGLMDSEYEVVCFNDCSSDGTLPILRQESKEHNNVVIVDAESNSGPGAGRNKAFGTAKGKYVWFVDADDLVVSSQVKELLRLSLTNDLDVLAFNYRDLDENMKVMGNPIVFGNTDVLDGMSFVDAVFGETIVCHMGYPVRFLIRREYLDSNGFLFPEDLYYGEDTVWFLKITMMANRIMGTDIVAYSYWHHETSVCGSFDRYYPAKTIFERCVRTSNQLFAFTEELDVWGEQNKRNVGKYVSAIFNYTKSHYVNQLPVLLCRTIRVERHKFYKIIKEQKCEVDSIKPHMGFVTKSLIVPVLGRIGAEVLSALYKKKRKMAKD